MNDLMEFEEAVVAGNDELATKKFKKYQHTWEKYCKEGNLDIIKWFYCKVYKIHEVDGVYMDLAASNGHLEIVIKTDLGVLQKLCTMLQCVVI